MEAVILTAFGVELQNIPEGMIIILPMIASGVSRKRTLLMEDLIQSTLP